MYWEGKTKFIKLIIFKIVIKLHLDYIKEQLLIKYNIISMKKFLISFVLLLTIFITQSYAQDQIVSKDAKDNIGKTVQVKGKVASVFVSQKGSTFINFDEKSPNQTFTVVVMSGTDVDISKIKEESILTIYGEIKEYKGKPEIILKKSEQIISIE